MRIFISHSFVDENLAASLKSILENSKQVDHAYMAQRVKEYELLISDKIRNEITNSDYVVALVTKNARESASVNQELGYSQGKDVPRIAMIEQDAKIGVLMQGMDSEVFTRENFDNHCKNVLDYLLVRGKRKIKSERLVGISPKLFLKYRNLVGVSQRDYESKGRNSNTEQLSGFKFQSKSSYYNYPTYKKPFVLFSVCPKRLNDNRAKINSENFSTWIKESKIISVKQNEFIFPIHGIEKFTLDSITFFQKREDIVDKYFEFQRNGFFEMAIGKSLFSVKDMPGKDSLFFNHCWMTGSLWLFLKFIKLYYDFIGYENKFDFFLTLRNESLNLMGFGGKSKNHNTFPEPYTSEWNGPIPHCYEHLTLTLENLTKQNLTDEVIEKNVRELSDKIANAFGLKESLCYNEVNREFNFNYFASYFN